MFLYICRCRKEMVDKFDWNYKFNLHSPTSQKFITVEDFYLQNVSTCSILKSNATNGSFWNASKISLISGLVESIFNCISFTHSYSQSPVICLNYLMIIVIIVKWNKPISHRLNRFWESSQKTFLEMICFSDKCLISWVSNYVTR